MRKSASPPYFGRQNWPPGMEMVERAMKVMDDGYMGQDYYEKAKRMISLEDGREETHTYDTYGWTEHISRKWGQWHPDIDELLDNFKECGLDLERE